MEPPKATAVFLPENEPYLGLDSLHLFDLLIVRRLEEHAQIASYTSASDLSDLQRAVIQIVPQAVSISLAIRELIRQAYLFPAVVLLRPLIERTAIVAWLRTKPDAVAAWHAGWPRSKQPRLPEMIVTLHGWDQLSTQDPQKIAAFSTLLHQIVHGDPAVTHLNVIVEPEGKATHGMGKVLQNPALCEFVSLITLHYFSLVTKLAQEILLPQLENQNR